jgi:hypothetical protein
MESQDVDVDVNSHYGHEIDFQFSEMFLHFIHLSVFDFPIFL